MQVSFSCRDAARLVNTLVSGLLAGICISIGGTVFLSVENKIIGASLFSIGLFLVVSFKFWLFTGRVGYVLRNPPFYLLSLAAALLGNLCGAVCTAFALQHTRVGTSLAQKAVPLCVTKLEDNLCSIFILAVFCGILMYAGVEGFASFEHPLGKYLSIYLAVSVFILCGFEHCVANMYYFSICGAWADARAWWAMGVMVAGNAVGSILFAFLHILVRKKEGIYHAQ